MMNCHDVQSRLSDFFDGASSKGEGATISVHLQTCDACRGVFEDLKRLHRAASSLGAVEPPDHIWLQIMGQAHAGRRAIGAKPERVARRAAVGQWIGLAAALVMITIGAHFFLRTVPAENVAPVTASNPVGNASVKRIADELALATQHYDNAITALEELAKSSGDVLDAQMTDALRQNIQTVNAAIDESRAALAQNPDSQTAGISLLEALRRKVVVLQATVNLMNEMRKGNQTGAVEAVSVFAKKS